MLHRSIPKNIIYSWILIAFFLFSPKLNAYDEALLRLQIEELDLSVDSEGVESSLLIQNALTGKTIYSRDEKKLLNPASNAKILSTLAALSYLTPEFVFKTQLLGGEDKPEPQTKKKKKKKKIKFYRLEKDGQLPVLTLKGFGDPSFTSYNLRKMVRELRTKGIRSVGEIRVDKTYFDHGNFTGSENFYGSKRFSLEALFFDQDQYDLGTAPGSSSSDPAWAAGQQLILLLHQSDIACPDLIRFQAAPANSILLAENKSTALKDLLPIINKKSDNFLAEQITKVLGAEMAGPPGSTAKGVQGILRELNATGIDVSGIFLENGSGLSRNSRVTTRSLVSAMQRVFDNGRLHEPFITTLSILGMDGTLRKRFRNSELAGRFVGKTGTLNGVSALTGYAYPLDGSGKTTYIVSHLINGSGKNFWARKHLNQKILEVLVNNQGSLDDL